jgi:hypothetical protein
MKEKSRVLTVVFATLELFFHEEGDSVVIHRKHAQPCPKLVRVHPLLYKNRARSYISILPPFINC